MNLNNELFSAVQVKDYSKVKSLVEQGADVNARDSDGKTPLHYAASLSLDIVKYLVEKGADIKAKDNDDITPLHNAAGFHLDVVKYLLAKGADINARDNDYGYTPLYTPVFASDLDMVKYLVENGANVKVTDNYGSTVLHNAVTSSTLEMVKYFVAKGANVNAKDGDGNTPLHNAVSAVNRKLETVKYLVENGAKVNIKNGHNKTPLNIVQGKCPKSCKEIIDFLKEKSTNPGSRGIKQITEPVNSTTPSNRTQKNSHIRRRRDAQSIYSMPRYLNPDIDPRIPQLAHVQDGANPPQAIPNNTIPSFNSTMLLVDVLMRKWTGQKPISVPSPDLPEDHQTLSDALRTSNNYEEFTAAFNEKSNTGSKQKPPKSHLKDVSIIGGNITRSL